MRQHRWFKLNLFTLTSPAWIRRPGRRSCTKTWCCCTSRRRSWRAATGRTSRRVEGPGVHPHVRGQDDRHVLPVVRKARPDSVAGPGRRAASAVGATRASCSTPGRCTPSTAHRQVRAAEHGDHQVARRRGRGRQGCLGRRRAGVRRRRRRRAAAGLLSLAVAVLWCAGVAGDVFSALSLAGAAYGAHGFAGMFRSYRSRTRRRTL